MWHQKCSPAPGAQHSVPSTTATTTNPSQKRTTHQEKKGVFYERVLGEDVLKTNEVNQNKQAPDEIIDIGKFPGLNWILDKEGILC